MAWLQLGWDAAALPSLAAAGALLILALALLARSVTPGAAAFAVWVFLEGAGLGARGLALLATDVDTAALFARTAPYFTLAAPLVLLYTVAVLPRSRATAVTGPRGLAVLATAIVYVELFYLLDHSAVSTWTDPAGHDHFVEGPLQGYLRFAPLAPVAAAIVWLWDHARHGRGTALLAVGAAVASVAASGDVLVRVLADGVARAGAPLVVASQVAFVLAPAGYVFYEAVRGPAGGRRGAWAVLAAWAAAVLPHALPVWTGAAADEAVHAALTVTLPLCGAYVVGRLPAADAEPAPTASSGAA